MRRRIGRLGALVRDFDFQGAGKWLLLGALVGVVAGLGAMAFQTLLQLASGFCLTHLAGLPPSSAGGEPPDIRFTIGSFVPWLVVLLPALGGLASGVLVYRLAPEAEGGGTDPAILAYHRKRGRIHWKVPLVKLAATVITLGTGGSGGREGPIAQIGAGFGSFLATRLGLSTRSCRWLLAAGIGAGVGAIFRAPLAGALFAGEVLYSSTDVETEVLLPATVASIVAYSIYAIKFGWGHMFVGAGAFGFSNPLELGPYLVLALVVALAALLYVKTFYGLRGFFARLPVRRELKPMIGGAATGLLGLLLIGITGNMDVADVLSSGYGVVQKTITTDGAGTALGILLLIALGKILTTSLSVGSGGSAGLFGPSMVIGATLGGAVGKLFHLLLPGIVQHPTTFAIVGMAGFFAAAANTPISTVIMVSELTGNYELLMPTMWVCALAFLASKRWSIFRNQVPSRLWSPAHYGEYAQDIFAGAQVRDVFKQSRRFVSVLAARTLEQVLDATAETRQRLYPVVDAEGLLVGTFRIDDLTSALHDASRDPRSLRAADLMHHGFFSVRLSDSVARAQGILRNNGVEELLVVDDAEPRRVIGIITGADILLSYTRALSRLQLAPSADGAAAAPHGETEARSSSV